MCKTELGAVLEGEKGSGGTKANMSQIVNKVGGPIKPCIGGTKANMSQIVNKVGGPIKPCSKKKTTSGFLEFCSFCKMKLLPEQNIYMSSDRPFCTRECRRKQIFKDEKETTKKKQRMADSIVSSSTKNSKSCFNPMFYLAF
ncbi:FCS-Like Zinc finger 16 isoform X1 [Capsicum galapagoense]